MQKNDPGQAEQLLWAAIGIRKDPSYYSNLAIALKRQGRLEEAVAVYRDALELRPDYPEVLSNLGIALRELGRLDQAVTACRRALELRPDYPDAFSNLGIALQEQGHLDEAVAAYRRALELRPDYPEALSNLGIALREQGRVDEEIAAYRRALDLRPDDPEALCNLGSALQVQGHLDQAVAAYRRALDLRPDDPDALCNLGIALQEQGHFDEAAAAYRRALDLRPDFPDALSNLSVTLREQGHVEQAVAACRRALDIKPDHPGALCNLGTALQDQGQLDQAVAAYRHALDIKPDHADAHWNLSLALLLQGNFQQGWEEYEWRWRRKEILARNRNFPQPLWSGEVADGKTILLHAEQGLGDSIQFIRYVPAVMRRGWRVVVEVPRALIRLFGSLPGITLIARGEPLPRFDSHCPLLSLPRALGAPLQTLSESVPYLSAPAKAVERWRGRLDHDGFRVGLVWAGSPTHKNDRNRSIPLEKLAPLLQAPGVRFHSLQKEPRPADRDIMAALGDRMTVLGPELNDFTDTAAVLGVLDLFIGVDTSVAHLAGALGRPAWVLLPFSPDWRWMMERADSPWYPTLRLFRQRAPGDWPEVIGRVAEALDRHLRAVH